MDWTPLRRELEALVTAATGRLPRPPLVVFKMLLLQHFYGLSDPQCDELVGDRLSWRSGKAGAVCGAKPAHRMTATAPLFAAPSGRPTVFPPAATGPVRSGNVAPRVAGHCFRVTPSLLPPSRVRTWPTCGWSCGQPAAEVWSPPQSRAGPPAQSAPGGTCHSLLLRPVRLFPGPPAGLLNTWTGHPDRASLV